MPPPLRAAAALGLSYRPITDADLPFLAELYASTRTEELAVTGWPEEVKRQFLAQQFDAQHRHYMAQYPDAEWLVIERGGERIGRLYSNDDGGRVHLIDMALLPASRGLGIGSAIFADVLDRARSTGEPVTLHVERHNPAIRLYERLGFVHIRDDGFYGLMEWRPSGPAP